MQCRAHAEVVATQACTSCNAAWCDDCGHRVGSRVACPECGHALSRADAPEQPFDVALKDVARRVFSADGLITAGAFAIVYAGSAVSFVLELIFLAALTTYYFVIIRHVGDGKSGLPTPADTVDDWYDTLNHAIRGIVCVGVGFLPVIVYLFKAERLDLTMILGLLMVGQLYMPAAVLAVTISNNTFGAIWPVAWIQIIARAPDRYAKFAFVWMLSIVAGFGLMLATSALLPPNVIGALGAAIAWCLYSFGQAVLVGHFLQQNRSRFGLD